jgi:rRNA biogenesis protein RRP5
MAPIKRKADQGAAPAKKDNRPFQDRSAKRQRKSDVATEDTKSMKPAIEKLEPAPQKSIFKDEEKSFPRGGASVLTPLEHKQIQIKATQDVLFEQSGQKRSGEDGLSDGSDIEMEEAPKAGKKKKSKKGKKGQAVEEEKTVRVEGLSYKVSFEEYAL